MRVLCGTVLMAQVAIGLACLPPPGGEHDSGAAAQSESRRTIEHLVPTRDSVGATPSRFEWTPVEGTEHYVFVVFNEVDGVVYRRDDLETASVAWPPDEKLDWGTYFWTVTALRDERPIAESGRAAFVVIR